MTAERKGAIEIFKVAGIQVTIDYSWLIIFALILWSLASGYFPAKCKPPLSITEHRPRARKCEGFRNSR